MMEARNDTASEAGDKGDYFFLFDNQVDDSKARREPRRKRLFRRFSQYHSKDWRARHLVSYEEKSPDTTALMTEDEHSTMHSCTNDEEDGPQSSLDWNPKIIWPETMSLVEDSPQVASSNKKILMKKWKTRMGKSLRNVLAKKNDTKLPVGSLEKEADEDDGSASLNLLEQTKKKLLDSMASRSQRAQAALYEEDVELYVYTDDDDVETVYRSTFEELCVPSMPDSEHLANECRNQHLLFPQKVSLDNGFEVARLLRQGSANLVVNYDSDFAQLELQSDDEYSQCDMQDDVSFTDKCMLPTSPQSSGEETEYNLFAQSSADDDNVRAYCGRHQSLLTRSSTVSEDPSVEHNIDTLCSAYPLPLMRFQQNAVSEKYSEDLTLFSQESSSIDVYLQQDTTTSEDYSESSHLLGAKGCHPSVREHILKLPKSSSTSTRSSRSSEGERRLGISCAPVQITQATLEDAANVWERIYAPPKEALPSPTPVQKSRSPWGCGLDASPLSVNSDISESEAGTDPNPFYNIRRFTSCRVVEEEDHPFDEVDTNKCVPKQPPPASSDSFGCGVPELVRSSLYHKNSARRPRCECVKCSVTNMYANLLLKK